MKAIAPKYDHKQIETQFKDMWAQNKIYKTLDSQEGDKYYILDMFPYPSGAGLHVGHVEGYTATDIVSRFWRMNGKRVLHPMGWDAFGLPAENYAIKTGVHPKLTTQKAIETFTQQINNLGLSYDWEREIGTHTPEYYRWTQWFFLLLYKNKLAYKGRGMVNWCESCKTVLANEQVVDGKCERCKNEVRQKDLEQWFFKITDFADDLINDLDLVDWPESTVKNQRNWVGRSEGIEITYKIVDRQDSITVFTTRPDTNFGATFIVVAPDSQFVQQYVSQFSNKTEVENYVVATTKKTELERLSEGKKKSGVFTGWYALNQLNNKKLPIYVGDFVLSGVGTGCVVGVPGHDQRDFEFAQAMGIEVMRVVVGTDGDTSEITNESQVQEEAGKMIHSDFLDGLEIQDAKVKMMDYLEEKGWGKKVVRYKLRDWLVSRQRYWGAPIPVVYDPEGNAHAVPEEHLPWLLPTDVEFKPTGVSPLASSVEFIERTERIFGKGWKPEFDTMDTFVCSSWYFFRFTDPQNSTVFADPANIAKWAPVDIYVGGAEHTVLHLMYARFFTKVLHKLGYIHFKEPFLNLRHQGTVLAEDGLKMSKSLGNVINPDDLVSDYGADAVRMYEMFMGPFSQSCSWNTNGLLGVRKFLDRVWNIQKLMSNDIPEEVNNDINRELHLLIQRTSKSIPQFQFNTVVSAMMSFVNTVYHYNKISGDQYRQFIILLAPFAPFVSEAIWQSNYVSDRDILLKTSSIHQEKWPEFHLEYIVSSQVTIVVQVNGKRREEVVIDKKFINDEEAIYNKIISLDKVKLYLNGKKIVKKIYVTGKLFSLVVA